MLQVVDFYYYCDVSDSKDNSILPAFICLPKLIQATVCNYVLSILPFHSEFM